LLTSNLKMNLWFFIWVYTFLQMYSNVFGQENCMSLLQITAATKNLCQQRDNKILWQKVIDCHRPLTDEFMRQSGEAQCPSPKYVDDPTNTNHSIQDVFYNICGLVDGGLLSQISTGICLLAGKTSPYIMSHSTEVAAVQSTWGNDVPCNIGKCILKLGLNT